MTNSVFGTFSGIKSDDAGKGMEAVQIYPSNTIFDLPLMEDAAWGKLTDEQKKAQLAWEKRVTDVFKDLYGVSEVSMEQQKAEQERRNQ